MTTVVSSAPVSSLPSASITLSRFRNVPDEESSMHRRFLDDATQPHSGGHHGLLDGVSRDSDARADASDRLTNRKSLVIIAVALWVSRVAVVTTFTGGTILSSICVSSAACRTIATTGAIWSRSRSSVNVVAALLKTRRGTTMTVARREPVSFGVAETL